MKVSLLVLLLGLTACADAPPPRNASDPLPSWNDGASKQAILRYVDRVTTEGGADYRPPAERIAVFDNDGTLWSEQPMYFQLAFVLDRVKALAPQHPEWKEQDPFKSFLEGNVNAALAGGEKAIVELATATHGGMTTEDFDKIVLDWVAAARHPKSKRPYTEMVFQPMLEVLCFLRARGFKTYIVSGGGVDFMRPWIEKVYGIPPEQAVGSTSKVTFELKDGVPTLLRTGVPDFFDDKGAKPVGIHRAIGRRPLMAFGNSDGDLQMLQWTTAGSGARFALIVHHTDEAREWAYDRQSHIGKLDKALDEAPARGWVIVDMKKDWKRIFPFD